MRIDSLKEEGGGANGAKDPFSCERLLLKGSIEYVYLYAL